MKEDLKSEIRELQYALETADQIGRGYEDWWWLLSQSERATLVAPLRRVSILIRRTERVVEDDPSEAVRHATDLVDALRIAGESIAVSPDHAIGDLFGCVAEDIRDAAADLSEAVAR